MPEPKDPQPPYVALALEFLVHAYMTALADQDRRDEEARRAEEERRRKK